jgi:glycosyltransferase involved in cell wall biosynthesis
MFWSLARRVVYRFADAIVVQTSSVERWAQRYFSASRIRVIPNPAPEAESSCNAPRKMRILSVGRLEWQKGFDLLLHAFSRSRAHAMGYQLVILGDGSERLSLETLVEQLDLSAHVSLPGLTRSPGVWMEESEIFVAPSRFEGFPNSLLEAMTSGCAVVAYDCDSGPSELITHGVDGLLAPVGDIEALRSAIDLLASNSELRFRFSSSARTVKQRFSIKSVKRSWELVFEEVGRSGRTH